MIPFHPPSNFGFLTGPQMFHTRFALMALDHIGGFMPVLPVRSAMAGFLPAAAPHLDETGAQNAGLTQQLVESGDRLSFPWGQTVSWS